MRFLWVFFDCGVSETVKGEMSRFEPIRWSNGPAHPDTESLHWNGFHTSFKKFGIMGMVESKEKVHWVRDLEKAVLIAGFTGKPVCLLILKSLCPTCQIIEPKYSSSKEFRNLSKFFVMAKCVDQSQVEELYAPDGQYVPRIIFLDSMGKPMNQFFNSSSNRSESRYFYPQSDDVVKTMRNVLYYFYPYNKSQE